MNISLNEVIQQTDCRVWPNANAPEGMSFSGVAPLDFATPVHISFLTNEKYIDAAVQSKAGAILCAQKMAEALQHKWHGLILVCDDAYAAFAKVSQSFFKPTHPFSGVSPHAIIDKSAEIHPTATVFPFVFVGPGARVGKNSVLYSGCFLGAASTVGDDCILYPNVVVREGCRIGDRCIMNPGVVLGGDGFGFAPTAKENVKIPQIGGVEIAHDVELGSNTTIDRGALADTKIGAQTKIDNLVMIAHNVQIGENCLMAAQTGVAGSTTIGNHVKTGGQVGLAGHIKIGNHVGLTAQSGVSKNIPDNEIWGGTPARPFKEHIQQTAALTALAKKHLKK